MKQKILIFTDLHYGSKIENKDGKEGVNTHGHIIKSDLLKLKKAIIKENPDFVINLGDTVTAFSHEDAVNTYKDYLNIFADLPMPLYHLHGNHDFKQLNEKELNELVGQKDKVSFTHDNILHLFVKAYKDDEKKVVFVKEETIQWLEKEIANTDKKMAVYIHYPITEDKDNLGYYHINRPEVAFVQESKLLKDIFEKSGKVLSVISGHTHFFYEKKIKGIKHITIPSFSEDKDGKPSTEYGIVHFPSMDVEVKKIR